MSTSMGGEPVVVKREAEKERAASHRRDGGRGGGGAQYASSAMDYSSTSSSSSSSSTTTTTAGVGGTAREMGSAMGKLFGGDSVPYARRSEPALSQAEVAPADAETQLDNYELRMRGTLTAATQGRAGDDLAWALQSVRESENRSSLSSSSSSTSSVSGVAARSGTPPLVVESPKANRPTAYHLHRAHSADVVPRPEASQLGDMSQLRQQVALLQRNLEDEKKRRAMEQKLMQQKIIELQGLIRCNMPEQKRQLQQNLHAKWTPAQQQQASTAVCPTRTTQQQQAAPVTSRLRALRTSQQLETAQAQSPYKTMKLLSELRPDQIDLTGATTDGEGDENNESEGDEGDENETKETQAGGEGESENQRSTDAAVRAVEAKMAQQLTQLRARMRTVVLEAQNEAQSLRRRLEESQKAHERRERQLRMEGSLRVSSLEERQNYATKKMLGRIAHLNTQTTMLTDENVTLKHALEMRDRELQAKDARIRELELALGGCRIVMEAAAQQSQPQPRAPQRC